MSKSDVILHIGEYYLDGEMLCPGDDCPWETDSLALKAQFNDKSYADLLPE